MDMERMTRSRVPLPDLVHCPWHLPWGQILPATGPAESEQTHGLVEALRCQCYQRLCGGAYPGGELVNSKKCCSDSDDGLDTATEPSLCCGHAKSPVFLR